MRKLNGGIWVIETFVVEICTGAVTGTNPRVSAGIRGNGDDFCGNTAGTGPNFT